MDAISQQLFNVIFAIAGALGGWWMKAMWESMKDLQRADRSMASEVADLKVLVAGQYVKQDTFDRTIIALFQKLDRIEEKINHKVDRSEI